jgi:LysM repeat protein
MNRKIVYLTLMFIFCFGFVFSQTEKSNKTIVKDNHLFYVHDVQKGQTLYGLSKMYNVSIDEITTHNPSVKQGLKIGEQLYILASKMKVELYAVKKGETLYSIARNRGITEPELLAFNPGISQTLSIGQEIVVPQVEIIVVEEDVATTISSEENLTRKQKKALKEEEERQRKEKERIENQNITKESDSVFHIVELGETLYSISRKYRITVDEIKNADPEIGETISIGQRIYIPIEKEQQRVQFVDESKAKEDVVIKEGVKRQEYTVFVLMPLYLSQVDAIEPANIKSLADYKKVKSFDFIQFYEAVLLAAEDISVKYPNVKINLYVEDVSSTSLTEALVKSEKLDDADLIIGPFHAKEFGIICQYARNKDIALVNPFSEAFEFCGVPVYKGTTSATYQGEAFARYVLTKYPNANIIFASYQSDSENKQISAYKSGMRTIFNQSGKTINIHDVNLKSGGISGIKSAISSFNENFVFTFFEGELSVTNFTQNLNAAKLSNLTLVAPESWLDYDNIETEYFMNLKTHYIAQYFVNFSNPKVIKFIDAFRNAYDTEPALNLYAFQGYDFTYYFLSKLCETGTSFQSFNKDEDLLSTKFHFAPSSKSSSVLENSYVHIFKLRNYKYVDAYSDDLEEEVKPRRR